MISLVFQKQTRLQEDRRLMLGESLDAAQACFRVGYEDASYFNREYERRFGELPARAIEKLPEPRTACRKISRGNRAVDNREFTVQILSLVRVSPYFIDRNPTSLGYDKYH
jgi:AraC-like DNA-binding protein